MMGYTHHKFYYQHDMNELIYDLIVLSYFRKIRPSSHPIPGLMVSLFEAEYKLWFLKARQH